MLICRSMRAGRGSFGSLSGIEKWGCGVESSGEKEEERWGVGVQWWREGEEGREKEVSEIRGTS